MGGKKTPIDRLIKMIIANNVKCMKKDKNRALQQRLGKEGILIKPDHLEKD